MVTEENQEKSDKNPEAEAMKQEKQTNSDEIDLIEVFLAFWRERRIFYITLGAFIVLGLLIALTMEEEYTSEVKLLPEKSEQQGPTGGVAGLASQFGMGNIQSGQQAGIATRHYPNIAKSRSFIKPILGQKVFIKELNDSLTIRKYFSDYYSKFELTSVIADYTIGLPSTVLGWIKGSDAEEEEVRILDSTFSRAIQITLNLTESEREAIKSFKERLKVERDEEEGLLNISVEMPDPVLSAELTEKVTERLIDYIKDYRTEKARKNLKYTKERYEKARSNFKKAQERLAKFRDQSRGNLTEMARTEEQLLQSEYDVAFNVYNSLSEKLEQARLKLQEETPVVTVVEPAVIPDSPSSASKKLILIITLFLGFFVAALIVVGKRVYKYIKEAIREREG